MYKVLVVEDQKIPRDFFELHIKISEQYTLLDSVSSAAVADIYCANHNVDLVIMDIIMSDGSNGLDAAETIMRHCPETKIIIVTSTPDAKLLERARKIGVHSFWYKEYDETPFPEIIERTMAGESVYPSHVPVLKLGKALTIDFSEREADIIRLVAEGLNNEEIASRLFMAVQTVKNSINVILKKTGFKNRTVLACKAKLSGFVANLD